MKLAYLVILTALLVPGVARADEAQDHVDRATRAYNVQDWPTALREYKQAYELDPKPETLWSIAQTQRLSGDCRGAILTYRAYLRGASSAGANAAENWIKQCQTTLDAQQKAIDDSMKPEPAKPPVAQPQPEPQPQPQPVHPKAEHRSWLLDPLGDTLAVVGLAGLAGGSYYLLAGNSDMSAASGKSNYQQYSKAVDNATSEQHVGDIALIGGAVFAALATWRYISVASRGSDEAMQSFAPVVVPGGAIVTYGGSF